MSEEKEQNLYETSNEENKFNVCFVIETEKTPESITKARKFLSSLKVAEIKIAYENVSKFVFFLKGPLYLYNILKNQFGNDSVTYETPGTYTTRI